MPEVHITDISSFDTEQLCTGKPRTLYQGWGAHRSFTTYKSCRPLSPNTLALLSVSPRIREITVPIFFGENQFTLCLDHGVIPFLQDRSQLACESIRSLEIETLLSEDNLKAMDEVWQENFLYISRFRRDSGR